MCTFLRDKYGSEMRPIRTLTRNLLTKYQLMPVGKILKWKVIQFGAYNDDGSIVGAQPKRNPPINVDEERQAE